MSIFELTYELKKLFICIRCHHAIKAGLQAGLLAVDIAHHTVHAGKLLGVTTQQSRHAGIELEEVIFVFGVLCVCIGALTEHGAGRTQELGEFANTIA